MGDAAFVPSPEPAVIAIDLPNARRLGLACVRAQAQATLGVAVVSLGWGGGRAALSALGGGAIAGVTTLYASRRAAVPEYSAGAALQRVMVGECIKVLSTIALFAAAARVPRVVWPALLCGYAAALVASWVPLMRTADGGSGLEGARAAGQRAH
jgi:F0F1-type ATP synthase assembly protein I